MGAGTGGGGGGGGGGGQGGAAPDISLGENIVASPPQQVISAHRR